MDNLFNGDSELGGIMNKFINENWHEIAREVKPALARSIENILGEIISRIYDIYSVEQLLPQWNFISRKKCK